MFAEVHADGYQPLQLFVVYYFEQTLRSCVVLRYAEFGTQKVIVEKSAVSRARYNHYNIYNRYNAYKAVYITFEYKISCKQKASSTNFTKPG